MSGLLPVILSLLDLTFIFQRYYPIVYTVFLDCHLFVKASNISVLFAHCIAKEPWLLLLHILFKLRFFYPIFELELHYQDLIMIMISLICIKVRIILLQSREVHMQ